MTFRRGFAFQPYNFAISLLRLHFVFPLATIFSPFTMPSRERQQKNNPVKYTADLWENPLEQTQQPKGKRRGKNGTVLINGVPHDQQTLFRGEDLRVPFPNAPVNKVPDRLGMIAEPSTLFSRPEPEVQDTQNELFTTELATNTPTPAPVLVIRPREETREYQFLSLPRYHMLILDDRKQTHFVPAI